MKKLSLFISLCLTFAVLSSCARKDLSDEARNSWQQAEAEQSCDQVGEYRCKGLTSQQCSESRIWHTYEKCPFACNEATGKCYDPNDPTDPDRPLDTPAEVCRSIYDCYRQCLDDECTQACIELGAETPEGLNLFTAMLNCAANNCGGMTTAEDMNDCFLSYCKKEIEECNLAGSSDLIDPADSTDPTDPSTCTLDESILDCSSSEYCFAFKGEGVISADVNSDTYTDNAAATLFGFDSYNKDLDSAVSLFISTTFNDYQAVELRVNGDLDDGFLTTAVTTHIPISYIDNMKNNGSDRLSVAPVSTVYDFLVSHDRLYVKQCLIAASRMNYVDEFGGQEMPVGATQVCYTETDSFGVGETFRLAMRAELVTDVQALVDMFEQINYPEDLCSCFELSSYSEVDCSVFINDEPEEEIDDLPETPDDEPENPCDLNPCNGVEHSTGVCHMEDSSNYSCECDDPCWFWDGEACIHDDSCGE